MQRPDIYRQKTAFKGIGSWVLLGLAFLYMFQDVSEASDTNAVYASTDGAKRASTARADLITNFDSSSVDSQPAYAQAPSLTLGPQPLDAGSLMWSVTSVASFDEFYEENPGLELSLSHTVYNTTPGTNPDDALPQLTLSGGANQGVFYAEAPSGWTISILSDTTQFTAPGTGISAGSSDVFAQYSTSLSHQLQPADAVSVGSGSFPTIHADTPTVYPAITNVVFSDDAAVAIQVRSLMVGISSHLVSASSVTGAWIAIQTFVPNTASTNLTYLPTNETAAEFFRVIRDAP